MFLSLCHFCGIQDQDFFSRTDKYECTSEDRERDGKKLKPECVVRRGDTMEMKVTFKGDYEKKKHDLTLQFTIGRSATCPNLLDIYHKIQHFILHNMYTSQLITRQTFLDEFNPLPDDKF